MAINKLKIAVACSALLGVGVANAGIIPWIYEHISFEDTSIDFFYDQDSNGRLDIGDVLTAVFEIERMANADGAGQKYPQFELGAELTGISAIEVTDKIDLGGGNYYIAFGPAAASLWPDVNTVVADVNAYPGTMNLMYEDASKDLDITSCTDLTDCATRASNGTLFQADGMPAEGEEGYDADNQWAFIGSDDITYAQGQPASSEIGTGNYVLSNLFNLPVEIAKGAEDLSAGCGGIYVCAGDGYADLVGSTTVMGGAGIVAAGAIARGNLAFQKVPAPAPLALMAFGLLGLGGRRFFAK